MGRLFICTQRERSWHSLRRGMKEQIGLVAVTRSTSSVFLSMHVVRRRYLWVLLQDLEQCSLGNHGLPDTQFTAPSQLGDGMFLQSTPNY